MEIIIETQFEIFYSSIYLIFLLFCKKWMFDFLMKFWRYRKFWRKFQEFNNRIMQIFADLIWIFEQYLHVLCNIEYTMVVTYEKKKYFCKKI